MSFVSLANEITFLVFFCTNFGESKLYVYLIYSVHSDFTLTLNPGATLTVTLYGRPVHATILVFVYFIGICTV